MFDHILSNYFWPWPGQRGWWVSNPDFCLNSKSIRVLLAMQNIVVKYFFTENSYQTINLQCNIDLIKQIPNPTPTTHTTFQQKLIMFVLEHCQSLASITSSSKQLQQIRQNVYETYAWCMKYVTWLTNSLADTYGIWLFPLFTPTKSHIYWSPYDPLFGRH